MWDKITRFFDKVDTLWCDFKRGIKNLIIWFPAVWRDRQWDHQYIYMMMRAKLNFQEQYIRKYGIHINNIEDANKIKVCVNLLDRLIKDEYHETAFKNHEKKWGQMQLNFKDTKDYPDMQEAVITHPYVKTNEDKKNERKDFRRSCNHETDLREQDLDLLFKMMRKHIQGWWD